MKYIGSLRERIERLAVRTCDVLAGTALGSPRSTSWTSAWCRPTKRSKAPCNGVFICLRSLASLKHMLNARVGSGRF